MLVTCRIKALVRFDNLSYFGVLLRDDQDLYLEKTTFQSHFSLIFHGVVLKKLELRSFWTHFWSILIASPLDSVL